MIPEPDLVGKKQTALKFDLMYVQQINQCIELLFCKLLTLMQSYVSLFFTISRAERNQRHHGMKKSSTDAF